MTASIWPRVRLKDLGTWFGGGTPSKANRGFWTNGTVPWLSPKDMGSEVLAGTQDHITQDAVENSSVKRVPAGSVAVVVRSGILERTFPVALVPFETTLNQDMKAVVAKGDIDARWIAWGLRSSEQEMLRTCRKTGTTVASMEMPRLYAHTIPVPPLDEQRRIIDILEDHLSRLDAAAGQLESVSPRVELLRRILLAARFGPSAFDGLPRIPLARLTQTSRKIAYGVLVPGPHIDDGVPLVRISDIRGGLIDSARMKRIAPEIDARFPRTRVYGGEILLSVVGTIGRVAVTPQSLAGANVARAVSMIPLTDDVLPEFAAYALRSPTAQRWLSANAHEVARKTLNLEDVKRFELPVPPLQEQARVVEELDTVLGDVGHAGATVEAVASRAPSLRAALLNAAFSGRLTGKIGDMEMAEEMASV